MAARASILIGAERVIVIDRYQERLAQVEQVIGAETMNCETSEVLAELREITDGRGPDVCIEAVGMEAHRDGIDFAYDPLKQQLRLQTDRPTAVREAIFAARKGGSVFVLGVFGGFVDKFPLGAIMNKGLTLRSSTATTTLDHTPRSGAHHRSVASTPMSPTSRPSTPSG